MEAIRKKEGGKVRGGERKGREVKMRVEKREGGEKEKKRKW